MQWLQNSEDLRSDFFGLYAKENGKEPESHCFGTASLA